MSDIGRLVLERLERDGTLDAYDLRALGGLLEYQEAESAMLADMSDYWRTRAMRMCTVVSQARVHWPEECGCGECIGAAAALDAVVALLKIEPSVVDELNDPVAVLIDAAEALVEACSHGAGEPIDGRYTGVRVVELDAFASALAAVRRTKEGT